ncbi:MAG TPA: hypothetical protein VG890_18040 [Puia sp.]|nr:hypothetical protein [Puia sp.]
MKQLFTVRGIAFSLMLLCSATVKAQTLKDFFNNEGTIAFYVGIDFTLNKVIDDANANVTDIRDRQYNGLNDLVVDEAKKYDVKSAFHRSGTVDHDLSLVADRNTKANADAIKSTNTADFHRLKEADIQNLVSGFDFKDKKGLGILFVSEAMSKSEKAIALWAVIVDMGTKKVLLTDRVEGKVGMGFGFRNYWATGIKAALDQIEKKRYKEWKSKAGV